MDLFTLFLIIECAQSLLSKHFFLKNRPEKWKKFHKKFCFDQNFNEYLYSQLLTEKSKNVNSKELTIKDEKSLKCNLHIGRINLKEKFLHFSKVLQKEVKRVGKKKIKRILNDLLDKRNKK